MQNINYIYRPPLALKSVLDLIIILVFLLKGPMCSHVIVCLCEIMCNMQPGSLPSAVCE